jgi:GrpB-like predicted nucleotidyltransferase (UPF0157 family)
MPAEPDGPLSLHLAEEFQAEAALVLQRERALLQEHGIAGELVLVGGTSVPGALTKGDVDLHLRVTPADFAATVELLQGLHTVVHPEIWQPSLATFEVAAVLPTGLAVTPLGSEHDVRFNRTWRLIAADPELVAAYNAAKLAGAIGDADYEQRKSLFFDRVLELWDGASGNGDEPLSPPAR